MAKESDLLLANQLKTMKKFVEISAESIERLKQGRYIEGSLRIDECTGKLTFRAYQRKSCSRQPDKLIAELEHGWLKESPKRYKFFNSVKKTLEIPQVQLAMQSNMNVAMAELDVIGLFKMN